MKLRILAMAMLAACGGGGSDAPDAPPVAMTINVSGTASSIGLGGRTPEAGVVVAAYRSSDEATVVAMATSGADGMYSIAIPTDGSALDGYLLAKKAGFKDTYLYPPAPLAADTNAATVLMLTQATFNNASSIAQAPQEPGKGWIGIMVLDAANNPVEGATISSSPAGTVRYNMNNLPNRNATATAADGIGYIFNVNAGTVNVSASKAGSTFRAHDVKARADQITTTLIQ